MEFRFSVYTVIYFNNMAELYLGDNAYLGIKPSDDLSRLPQRYRDFIYGHYRRPGEADRAWATLREIAQKKLARMPNHGFIRDLAWLLGLAHEGGDRLAEARIWQQSAGRMVSGRRRGGLAG